MKITPTELADVLIVEPKVFGDARGFFYESWNRQTFRDTVGLDLDFVQDNHSRSVKNVLRGLHYQVEQPQGKLVRCTLGGIFDVAVDMRRSSPAFGQWIGVTLSAANKRMVWIPPGFAHGFLVLTEFAEVLYKATDFYAPEHERAVAWDDPELEISWPLEHKPILSTKDSDAPSLRDAEGYP